MSRGFCEPIGCSAYVSRGDAEDAEKTDAGIFLWRDSGPAVRAVRVIQITKPAVPFVLSVPYIPFSDCPTEELYTSKSRI